MVMRFNMRAATVKSVMYNIMIVIASLHAAMSIMSHAVSVAAIITYARQESAKVQPVP